MTDKVHEYKLKAVKMLSRRQLTTFELRKKLMEKGCDEDILDEVVEYLLEEKLLDDEMYTKEWIAVVALRRGYGFTKILQMLLKRGIDGDLIKDIYNEKYKEGERERAFDVAQKKMSYWKPDLDTQKRAEKIARFLQGRGFSSEIIYDVLDKLDLRVTY